MMTTAPSEVIPLGRDGDGPVPRVVARVDTHKDTHHVAVLDAGTGARLGDAEVTATMTGYGQLLDFIASFGLIVLVGIEGTNSYGAGVIRFLTGVNVPIREVIRPKRAQRRRGKPDPIDEYAAAQQAPAEPADLPVAKTSDEPVEQTGVLMTVRRSAMKARVAALRQLKSLLITAPDGLRARRAHLDGDALVDMLAASRPAPATGLVTAATGQALRRLGRRHRSLTEEIAELDAELRDQSACGAGSQCGQRDQRSWRVDRGGVSSIGASEA